MTKEYPVTTKKKYPLILLILFVLVGCQAADLSCQQIENDTTQGSAGCNFATGDVLCTEQCQKDFPAPEGKTTFGIAGETMKGSLACKCYQKRLR
jgi:hypothetical protein